MLSQLTTGLIEGMVVGLDVVRSLSLTFSDCAQYNVMVYGAEFGVVVLAEGPRRASVQESLDHFSFHYPEVECEIHIWSVVELFLILFYPHPNRVPFSGDFGYCIGGFGNGSPTLHRRLRLRAVLSCGIDLHFVCVRLRPR